MLFARDRAGAQPSILSVQCFGVDNRRCVLFADEDDKRVGDHGGLTFVVDFDVLLFQAHKRFLYKLNGTLDDRASRRDDRRRLLASQHGACDFRCVGKVRDAGVGDLDARGGDPIAQFSNEVDGYIFPAIAQRNDSQIPRHLLTSCHKGAGWRFCEGRFLPAWRRNS